MGSFESLGPYLERREAEARAVWQSLARDTAAGRVVRERLGDRWPVRSDWDGDAILAAIALWAELHGAGRPPVMRDWSPSLARDAGDEPRAVRFEADGCWPTNVIVRRACRSWNAAIERAGFTPLRAGVRREFDGEQLWTRARIEEALRAWAAAHGRAPRVMDAQQERKALVGDRSTRHRTRTSLPVVGTVVRTFGSWDEGIRQAGLEPAPRGRPMFVRAGVSQTRHMAVTVSRDMAIEQVQAWRVVHGHSPTGEDWDDPLLRTTALLDETESRTGVRGIVSSGTLHQIFGSFSAALIEAGLQPQAKSLRRTKEFRESWSRDRMLDALREWSALTGAAPYSSDWASVAQMHDALASHGLPPTDPRCDHQHWPTTRMVRHAFGSWNQALREAGFPERRQGTGQRPRAKHWTRERIIAALQHWTAEHGSPPTVTAWSNPAARRGTSGHWPSPTPVLAEFGSWNNALRAAGLAQHIRSTPARIGWTPERVIAALRHWSTEHDGHTPTSRDWTAISAQRLADQRAGRLRSADQHPHPSASTVRKIFGNWNAAIIAAGLQEPDENASSNRMNDTAQVGQMRR